MPRISATFANLPGLRSKKLYIASAFLLPNRTTTTVSQDKDESKADEKRVKETGKCCALTALGRGRCNISIRRPSPRYSELVH